MENTLYLIQIYIKLAYKTNLLEWGLQNSNFKLIYKNISFRYSPSYPFTGCRLHARRVGAINQSINIANYQTPDGITPEKPGLLRD